jgi:two-component system, OmpR family, sensor histidine kinase CssS
MVIRSYAQSIHDGIFPRGSLEESIIVIEKETHYLEERVKTLLNLTKYDYLSTHKLDIIDINLTKLIRDKIAQFSWRRSDLIWEIKLEEITIKADREKLLIILDNILDNQIRYANKLVKIELNKNEATNSTDSILLRFWNDGPYIEEDIMKYIFEKFKKGDKGKNGLGLAITKMIVNMHQGEIWAKNEDEGVAFYIRLAI